MLTLPSNHPIWSLARLGLLMIALTVILWLTAHSFDKTELQTIIVTFMAAGSIEGAVRLAKKVIIKKDDATTGGDPSVGGDSEG